jgi:hypothetical protein
MPGEAPDEKIHKASGSRRRLAQDFGGFVCDSQEASKHEWLPAIRYGALEESERLIALWGRGAAAFERRLDAVASLGGGVEPQKDFCGGPRVAASRRSRFGTWV